MSHIVADMSNVLIIVHGTLILLHFSIKNLIALNF